MWPFRTMTMKLPDPPIGHKQKYRGPPLHKILFQKKAFILGHIWATLTQAQVLYIASEMSLITIEYLWLDHSNKFPYWSGHLLSLSCARPVLKCLSARGWKLVNSSPWSPSWFGKMVSREKHSRPCEGFYRTVDKLTDKKYKKIIVAYNIDDYHYSLAFVNSLHSAITRHDCIQVYSAYRQNRQIPKTKYVIFTRMKNIYK